MNLGYYQKVALISIVLLVSGQGVLANNPIDKSQYTLFNPVPEDLMRKARVRHTRKTKEPTTIDPGHLQIEFDFISLTRDHTKLDGKNTRTKSYSIFVPNFRVGLTDKLEADLIFSAYNNKRIRNLGKHTKVQHNGFGDLILRAKYNFWGNEGEYDSAFGAIPYIKIPTNDDHLGNHHVEGGLILPLEFTLINPLILAIMPGLNIVRGSNHHKYYASFPITGALEYDFTQKWIY